MPVNARGVGILLYVMKLEGSMWRLINMIMIFKLLLFEKTVDNGFGRRSEGAKTVIITFPKQRGHKTQVTTGIMFEVVGIV